MSFFETAKEDVYWLFSGGTYVERDAAGNPAYTDAMYEADKATMATAKSDQFIQADKFVTAAAVTLASAEDKAGRAIDTLTDVDKLQALLGEVKWILIAAAVLYVAFEFGPLLKRAR